VTIHRLNDPRMAHHYRQDYLPTPIVLLVTAVCTGMDDSTCLPIIITKAKESLYETVDQMAPEPARNILVDYFDFNAKHFIVGVIYLLPKKTTSWKTLTTDSRSCARREDLGCKSWGKSDLQVGLDQQVTGDVFDEQDFCLSPGGQLQILVGKMS